MPSKQLRLEPLTEDLWKRPPGHATELAATLQQINALLPLHVDSVRWDDQTLALRLADGSVVEITAGAIVTTLKLARNAAPGLTNAAAAVPVAVSGVDLVWDRSMLAGRIAGNRLIALSNAEPMIVLAFADGLEILVVRCSATQQNRCVLLWLDEESHSRAGAPDSA